MAHLLVQARRPVLNSIRCLSRTRILSYRDKEGHEFTTDDINRGPPYRVIALGFAASASLLAYAIYTTEVRIEQLVNLGKMLGIAVKPII